MPKKAASKSKKPTRKPAKNNKTRPDLASFWKTDTKPGGVEKLVTGIKGLDEALEGGIPKGRSLLVTGDSGSGKTVLLNEFIYRGLSDFGQSAVFVTFEERPADIKKNIKNFGWDYAKFEKEGSLAFVDASPELQSVQKVGDYNWLDVLLPRIRHALKKTGAQRLGIDGLGTLIASYQRKDAVQTIRRTLFLLMDELKKAGVTTIVTAENLENNVSFGDSFTAKRGIREYVSDGVIALESEAGENKIVRTILIKKMRGVGYRSGKVQFEITGNGIEVFPKIPVDTITASTDFSIRKKFGLPKLDEALGGGIPQGHMFLVGGNTGTGKTILGLHFLAEGVKNGEHGVFVALEESVAQVKKTAQVYRWNFEQYEKKGLLEFASVSLIDINPDKLLYKIVDAVNKQGAKRVVIDSVSSLTSATLGPNNVREFLLQLSAYFKANGIACVMNYLSSESFGANANQLLGRIATNEIRMSSIVDGIMILRYVEQKQRVEKLLNILKLRGSAHSRDIYRYEITKDGFTLGDTYQPTNL